MQIKDTDERSANFGLVEIFKVWQRKKYDHLTPFTHELARLCWQATSQFGFWTKIAD